MISNALSSLVAVTDTQKSDVAVMAQAGAYRTSAKMSQEQINKTAQDFEAMFVAQMLEQMFGDSIGTELFGDEETHEVYKGLMVEEYGRQIARAGGIGIASYVKTELLKLQEI